MVSCSQESFEHVWGERVHRYLEMLRNGANTSEMNGLIRQLDHVLTRSAARILANGPAGNLALHAEDAVQEWHIRVAKCSGRTFNDTRYCWFWGYCVLRSICVSIARREIVRTTRLLPSDAEEEARVVDIEEIWGEMPSALRAAIMDLEPKETRAITLVFYDGLTYAQAAQVENIPRGTMVGRTQRALLKLKKRLDPNTD
jgi:RNA polymerase sigma-70 factor, ECF subfamily